MNKTDKCFPAQSLHSIKEKEAINMEVNIECEVV